MGDILFLAHRVPFPPNRGDKIRAHHLLKRLADLAPVHVGCFAESEADRAAVAEVDAIAASHCVVDRRKPLVLAGAEAVLAGKPVSLTAFFSPRLDHWVRQALARGTISTIVVFSGQMGQYVPDDFAGQVLVDLCDVDSAKFESYAEAGERAWLNRREARLLAVEEQRLGVRADATFLISDNEADLYRSRLQQPALVDIRVMGNGIDTDLFDPSRVSPQCDLEQQAGPNISFVGQMDYRPNEEAVLWAARELMPELCKRYPEAVLHVVGRNPTASVRACGEVPGIQVWGEVPDVKPFVASANAVIAPLAIARGVQNKVLEAMSMARPVVLTQDAATGIDGVDGEHWLLSEREAEAMTEHLATLFDDPDRADRIGANARAFVQSNHSWASMLKPVETLIDQLGVRNAA